MDIDRLLDKEERYERLYLDIAKRIADMSFAQKRKVGAIAVKNGNILAFGFNGTPAGFDNDCEYRDYYVDGDYRVVTKPEVIHAEANLVAKSARDGISLKDSVVFVTTCPCVHCSLLLIQAGVKKVVYSEIYKTDLGIKFLQESGIEVTKR
jgi:dCMP deaminase